MKSSDIKIGMKVVPFKKTASGWTQELSDSVVWQVAVRKKQPYLYVVGITDNSEKYLIDGKVKTENEIYYHLNNIRQSGGDYFAASDFKPYKEK